jgi:hypothetical protein
MFDKHMTKMLLASMNSIFVLELDYLRSVPDDSKSYIIEYAVKGMLNTSFYLLP